MSQPKRGERGYTKAALLEFLKDRVECSIIDPFIVVKVADWNNYWPRELGGILSSIMALGEIVIVRSSAAGEDTNSRILPGTYRSVAGVATRDEKAVFDAIHEVAASYGCQSDPEATDEVIIQRQLTSPRLSGIAMSREPRLQREYFYIEYSTGGRTDSITSGRASNPMYVHRSSESHGWLRAVVASIREIETILDRTDLLLEFGLDDSGHVHLFQARTYPHRFLPSTRPNSRRSLDAMRQSIVGAGQGAAWSDMSDWNPVELLGIDARPLAVSLFHILISESSWARARSSLGYQAVRDPLVQLIGSKPYVRLDRSVASLIPNDLTHLTSRIVAAVIGALRENRHLHDKLEFDVVPTCHVLPQDPRMKMLERYGLEMGEVAVYRESLTRLTQHMLGAYEPGTPGGQINNRDVQMARRDLLASVDDGYDAWQTALAKSINTCVQYGTLPFAVEARYSFVAQDIGQQACSAGIVSREEVEHLYRHIATITDSISMIAARLTAGNLSKAAVARRIGYLRPSMFDIRSATYATRLGVEEDGDTLAGSSNLARPTRDLDEACRRVDTRITAVLEAELGWSGAHSFFDILSNSIEQRESLKFRFSAIVSAILESLATIGARHGLTREQLSFLVVEDALQLPATEWMHAASVREAEYWDSSGLVMPALVFGVADIEVVSPIHTLPSFITAQCVEAPTLVVNVDVEMFSPDMEANGKIILIRTADPGYDWLFSSGLAGLVTEHGGAGSHMAIRARILGVPAAIGCGEVLFERLLLETQIRLDCAAERVSGLARESVRWMGTTEDGN